MYVVCGCDCHLCRFAHAYKFTHACMQGGREACTYKHMLKWESGLHSSSSWWVGFSLVFISSIIHCLLKRRVSCSRKSPCLLANKHSHVTHRPLTDFFELKLCDYLFVLRYAALRRLCISSGISHLLWMFACHTCKFQSVGSTWMTLNTPTTEWSLCSATCHVLSLSRSPNTCQNELK